MVATLTDQQIRQNVLDSLQNDTRLDTSRVSVDVFHGTVTLSGTVPTYTQKIIAGEVTRRIKGVINLHNNLVVTLIHPTSDLTIAQTVRDNLFRDVRLSSPEKIQVQVTGGVVTLTGTVPSYDQKMDAEDDAWATTGIVDVVNDIVVMPSHRRPDAEIANDVRAALARDPSINAVNIGVRVTNGTVFLGGSVPSFYQVRRAADDAWSVDGVVAVVNDLKVSA